MRRIPGNLERDCKKQSKRRFSLHGRSRARRRRRRRLLSRFSSLSLPLPFTRSLCLSTMRCGVPQSIPVYNGVVRDGDDLERLGSSSET